MLYVQQQCDKINSGNNNLMRYEKDQPTHLSDLPDYIDALQKEYNEIPVRKRSQKFIEQVVEKKFFSQKNFQSTP